MLEDNAPYTAFAPAQRALPEEVRGQSKRVAGSPEMGQLLDNIPDLIMVLNHHRQVVHANNQLLSLLGLGDETEALGRRPGELMGCVHAKESPGGCGTTESCRDCGAVLAILSSQEGKKDLRECRIMLDDCVEGPTALDLQIWATPLDLNGERYSFLAVSDLADRKRRKALEKVFFHDLLNTAGGLAGLASLLREASPDELDQLKDSILKAAEQLLQEINAQRDLLAAENQELAVNPRHIEVAQFLRDQVELIVCYPVAQNRRIALDLPVEETLLHSDPTLVGRVVINLLKNALEACPSGGTATLGFRPTPAGVEIWTNNPGVMTPEVKRQVFQRSFSTKGPGRGLGTYSIKLLTERYLGGQVTLTSAEPEGTTFRVVLPPLPEENK